MQNVIPAEQDRLPRTALWLGRAGLIPFLALPFILALDVQRHTFWAQGLAAYSFGIVCFLLGSWWGLALIRRRPYALLLSNGVFLITFFSYLSMALPIYLVTASITFITLVVIEGRHPLFRLQPTYYRRLRVHLSATASLSLLAAAAMTWQA